MSEYRHTQTGEVKTQGQWRSHYSNVSLPRAWKQATLDGLNLEAVLEAPKPTAGQYETVARNGVTQDANGNWVTAWEVRDMFADTTDEDGVTTTKAEHEAAYQAGLDAKAGEAVRTKRNTLLAETDYFALTDVTMDAAMTSYRQALRDITDHANFPNLDDADWPAKP
jgi:hypothetical protein